MKDIKQEAKSEQLYTQRYKKIDRGLNPSHQQGAVYDHEGYLQAELSLKDPVVSTCFFLSIFPILKKNLVAKPLTDGLTPAQIEISQKKADFINYTFKKIADGGVKGLLLKLLYAKHFNFSLVEKCFDIFKAGPYAGYAYFKKFKHKKNGLWDFVYDANDNVIGYRCLLDTDSTPYPVDKFIRVSWLETFNNPNGNGDFEKIWKFFDQKRDYFLFLVMLGARQAKGKRDILQKTDGGAGNKSAHERMLQDLEENLQVFLPNGYTVKTDSFDTKVLQDFIAVIKELDSQIARAYLGSSLLVNESQTGTGNYAQSKNHKENSVLFQDYAEGVVIDALEEQYMNQLLRLNFDDDELTDPTLELQEITSLNLAEEIKKDSELIRLGILDINTEADLMYLRQKYNCPENKDLFELLEIKNEVAKENNTDASNQEDNTDQNQADAELYQD